MWVTLDKAKERYAFCKTCEHLTALKTCSVCKCLMPAKVTIAHTRCPVGLWGTEKSAGYTKNYTFRDKN
jgi:recombinational DNA repair protein RecR